MTEHRSPRAVLIEYWMPLGLWLFLIWFFSTDRFSSGETSHAIEPVLRFLFPGILSDQLAFWHAVIRKLGHISEYFILAGLAYRALKLEGNDLLHAKVRSFELLLLVAMTDEFHQSLTRYRGASVVDVAYDSFGGLLAFWLAFLRRQ